MTHDSTYSSTWRDKIDDNNIKFRTGVYKLLIKPPSNFITEDIAGIFGHIFDPDGTCPNIKFTLDVLDNGIFDISWDIPKEESETIGLIENTDPLFDPYWHFNMKLKHEFKEVFKDPITTAFN